jgi:hypothetical protein
VFTLDDVQIVNGLQTSATIFEHLSSASADDPARGRSLLVRIIVTTDPTTRDRVIRATNSQTAVSAASLRATDQVQRDLETFLIQRGWYYERRKNFYKNQGRNADRIVGIPFLAQAIMAIGFSEPQNSRARPSSLIKSETDYRRLFDPDIRFDLYLFATETQRRVDEFMRSRAAAASAQERTNLRFHLAMLVVARRLGRRVRHPNELRSLLEGTALSDEELARNMADLRDALAGYQIQNPDDPDKIAKSRDFVEFVLAAVFPIQGAAPQVVATAQNRDAARTDQVPGEVEAD